ncbi:unnamed protein product [Lactuca saligna]|uniref:Uncharacterized protein n=1 Tax=Lactuca saligna TaxID=75948 RepID=A0AA36E7S3_LACSI|nr:unnamed protein product [Lactuca saligna]
MGVFRRIKIKRKSQLVKKTQVTHQGVTVREVPAPVSPSSKKRRAEEMAKFLKKPKLVEDEELVPETPEADIPKEVEIFQSTEISKPADVKNLESTTLPQATSTIDSPTFQSIMNQPFTTIFSTQSTEPPQSLSPIAEIMAIDEETDNEGFGETFEDLSFDKSEEDFPDHMIMTMKPFKILNSKLNSILQSQADVGNAGINLLQVDSLMKETENRLLSKNSGLIRDSESRILEKIDQSDSSTENRIKFLRTDFLKEVKDLRMFTKERHVLFVQEVKKVREDVNMQIRELREEMTKEVQTLNQGYDSAHQKIDIICDVVVQCVKRFEPLKSQMTSLLATEVQHFGELVNLMKELKEISSKSSSSIISQEYLSQKFLHFEAILQKHLTPLLRISSLLPSISDAPPAVKGVQEGEKSVQEKAGEHEMKPEDSKAPVKPTIVSAAPVISTMTTTIPISIPSTKGIVIGNVVSSNVSSSKGAAPSNEKEKGKGILIEKTNKEKKAEESVQCEKKRLSHTLQRILLYSVNQKA